MGEMGPARDGACAPAHRAADRFVRPQRLATAATRLPEVGSLRRVAARCGQFFDLLIKVAASAGLLSQQVFVAPVKLLTPFCSAPAGYA